MAMHKMSRTPSKTVHGTGRPLMERSAVESLQAMEKRQLSAYLNLREFISMEKRYFTSDLSSLP